MWDSALGLRQPHAVTNRKPRTGQNEKGKPIMQTRKILNHAELRESRTGLKKTETLKALKDSLSPWASPRADFSLETLAKVRGLPWRLRHSPEEDTDTLTGGQKPKLSQCIMPSNRTEASIQVSQTSSDLKESNNGIMMCRTEEQDRGNGHLLTGKAPTLYDEMNCLYPWMRGEGQLRWHVCSLAYFFV